jgi:type 1 glutamine amidotransferase
MTSGIKPGGRVDAVLVCGGRWHDFDFARRELLVVLGANDRVKTEVFGDYDTRGALERADVLVTYTCDVRPTDEQQRELSSFVDRGGRWLALHGTNSAIDAPAVLGSGEPFRTPRVIERMVRVLGSQFLGHPPIEPYTVEVTDPAHPLVAGISPFEVTDELYCCELHGPLDVLLHTRYSGTFTGFAEGEWLDDTLRPVLYLKGNVCYFTLGHCRGPLDMQEFVDEYPRVERGAWDVPQYRTILERCVAWAATGAFNDTEATLVSR